LPILEGKTPREVCRTESGRQRVAAMIRSMPDSMGNVQIEIPREKMLRELGLQVDPIFNDFQSGPWDASPKVGRNEPCPCGSGKKYKKCCGR
jgi:hypothetical protein